MFAEILTDDRGVEYEMIANLVACKGIAGDFIADSTGLTAISTMGRCYEEEMDMLDGKFDDGYKPSLPEYNDFWRLIDHEESIMGAMVKDITDTVPTGWMADDIMFGWLRRVGSNPDMLRAASASDMGAAFPVTNDMYNQAMGESGAATLTEALNDRRLFIMDFAIFGENGITNCDWLGKTECKYLYVRERTLLTPPPLFTQFVPPFAHTVCGRYSPKALFAVPKAEAYATDGLRTVAIQQYQKPSADFPVVGAPNPDRRDWADATLSTTEKATLVQWCVMKTSVQVAESSYFEVVTHFGKTHMVMEPFMMATDNAFHPTHPMRKLLQPHFAGTDHINQGAVDSLIAAGGTIDKIFPPTIEDVQAVAILGAQQFLWDFNNQFFDVAFKNRGTHEGSKLVEYPFRDDGKLVWESTLEWTKDYIGTVYSSDAAMRNDPWLKCWWDMLVSPSYGMLKNAGDNGNGALYTRNYLAKVCALIIWTASGQHAATNFPQKDVGAHVTMNPAAAWDDAKTGEIDCSGDEALCWKKWFDMLPPIHEALDQLNTEYLLGSVHYNRLGRYEEDYAGGHFTGEARKKEEQFQARLVLMGEEIEERNKAVGTMRNHFKYIIMMPDNIPNSINI